VRRVLIIVAVGLLMTAVTASAQPGVKLGVGGFAGLSIPVIQDDQESGSEFGFKARWGLGKILVVEPNVTFTKWGKPGTVEGVDLGIDGSKLTGIGLDLVLGNSPGALGLKPYFMAGFGSYKVKNDDTGYDESNLGWNAGLGIGFGVSPKFDLDIRGKVVVAPQDQGSKKAFGIVAGLNFNFGSGIGAI